MTLGKKINLLLACALVILSVSIIYSGTVVIKDIIYDNMTQIMSLEITNILAKIKTSHETLTDAGVSHIGSYVENAQSELKEDFRKFSLGQTGQLFVFSKDKEIFYHKDIVSGQSFDYEFVDRMVSLEQGTLTFDYNDNSYFCVIDSFEDWNWIIGVAIT